MCVFVCFYGWWEGGKDIVDRLIMRWERFNLKGGFEKNGQINKVFKRKKKKNKKQNHVLCGSKQQTTRVLSQLCNERVAYANPNGPFDHPVASLKHTTWGPLTPSKLVLAMDEFSQLQVERGDELDEIPQLEWPGYHNKYRWNKLEHCRLTKKKINHLPTRKLYIDLIAQLYLLFSI